MVNYTYAGRYVINLVLLFLLNYFYCTNNNLEALRQRALIHKLLFDYNKSEEDLLKSLQIDKFNIISNQMIIKNGVKILGESNILNKLSTSASTLYAKNLYNFVVNLYDKKVDKIKINLEDEIIKNTLIK